MSLKTPCCACNFPSAVLVGTLSPINMETLSEIYLGLTSLTATEEMVVQRGKSNMVKLVALDVFRSCFSIFRSYIEQNIIPGAGLPTPHYLVGTLGKGA